MKYIYFALRDIAQDQFAFNLRIDFDKVAYLVSKTTENGEGSLV